MKGTIVLYMEQQQMNAATICMNMGEACCGAVAELMVHTHLFRPFALSTVVMKLRHFYDQSKAIYRYIQMQVYVCSVQRSC